MREPHQGLGPEMRTERERSMQIEIWEILWKPILEG